MRIDHRGFTIYDEFKDSYDANILIKQSDLRGYLWIFVEGGNIIGNKGSAHLTVGQAIKVRNTIDKWLGKNKTIFVIHKLPNRVLPGDKFVTECKIWNWNKKRSSHAEYSSTTRWDRVTCKHCLKKRPRRLIG